MCRDPSSERPSSYSSNTSQRSLCRVSEPQVGSLLLLGREQELLSTIKSQYIITRNAYNAASEGLKCKTLYRRATWSDVIGPRRIDDNISPRVT